MKTVLVTGASGQLGKEIVKHLKARHYTVIGIDLIESDTTDKLIDIRNHSDIRRPPTTIFPPDTA
jgi:nucleoside-diphosphate-sugar epimerase